MWEVNGDQMGGHCATEQKQLLFCFPSRVGYAPRELFCSVGWAGSRRLVCRTAGGSKRVLQGWRWDLARGVFSHPCTLLYPAQVQPVATHMLFCTLWSLLLTFSSVSSMTVSVSGTAYMW